MLTKSIFRGMTCLEGGGTKRLQCGKTREAEANQMRRGEKYNEVGNVNEKKQTPG